MAVKGSCFVQILPESSSAFTRKWNSAKPHDPKLMTKAC